MDKGYYTVVAVTSLVLQFSSQSTIKMDKGYYYLTYVSTLSY